MKEMITNDIFVYNDILNISKRNHKKFYYIIHSTKIQITSYFSNKSAFTKIPFSNKFSTGLNQLGETQS